MKIAFPKIVVPPFRPPTSFKPVGGKKETIIPFLSKSQKAKLFEIAKIDAAKEQLPIPGPNETVHFLSQTLNGWLVTAALIDLLRPATITEMWVSVLSYNPATILHMCELFDRGDINRIHLICSVYFRRGRVKNYTVGACELEKRGQNVLAVLNHSKIVNLRASDGRYFVVETSANFCSCASREQYTITQSRELYEYHVGWQKEEFEKEAHGR